MPQQMPQQLSGLGGLAGLLGGAFGQNTKPMMGQPAGGFGGAPAPASGNGGFGSAASPSSGGMFGGGGGFGK